MPRHATRRQRRPPAAAGPGKLILGFILAAVGAYFLTNQVPVAVGPLGGSAWFGPNGVGLLLVPLIVLVAGVGLIARVLLAGRNQIDSLDLEPMDDHEEKQPVHVRIRTRHEPEAPPREQS